MKNSNIEKTNPKVPRKYKIKVKGLIPQQWASCYESLSLEHEAENTILSGPVQDQAQLHGILNQIRDLNLVLLSVEAFEE